MSHKPSDISCPAKLALVVLDNCGPLAPSEVASEARLAPDEAQSAIDDLVGHGLAEPVCGVCDAREEVFALTKEGENRQRSS